MKRTLRLAFSATAIGLLLGGCMQGHGPKQTGGLLVGGGARRAGRLPDREWQRKTCRCRNWNARRCGTRQRSGSLFGPGRPVGNVGRGEKAAQHAPIGSSIRWENPSSGNYGSITPRREGRHRRSGAVCREFSNSLTIDGQTEDFVGVACRARDGG